MKLENVILPSTDSTRAWDIVVEHGRVSSIQPSSSKQQEQHQEQQTLSPPQPSLLLPPLCHPHIHLDKPYILTCNHAPASPSPSHPNYSDLAPQSGSFQEALTNTSQAKARYTPPDLYLRGSQLLAASYAQGVTSLRAFVELDRVTGHLPLVTAIRLKREFAHLLQVQICAFAQDPLFSSSQHGEGNRAVITEALEKYAASVDVLGSTPYVEKSVEAAHRNIEWAVTTALERGLHLDFHLDYNLTPPSSLSGNNDDNNSNNKPLTYSVLELLQKHRWLDRADKSKTIVLGHCTQLSVLPDSGLQKLAGSIIASKLPIHFVGLPTSDLFMMGRPDPDADGTKPHTHSRLRGTLQVPSLIKDLGLSACIGANNVGNAFTPYGSGDPLQLASWGVGIYQAGTVDDARLLYGCVSWRAREAIGLGLIAPSDDDDALPGENTCKVVEGQNWQPMLRIENPGPIELPAAVDGGTPLRVEARPRLSFKDVVWDPPEVSLRSVIL